MIVRSVAIVSNHGSGVNIGLDRCAERIGNRQFDIGKCRNECAGVDKEFLAGFIEYEPIQEVLCSLLLLFGNSVVNEEVLGTTADELGVVLIKCRGNRHHAHILAVVKCADVGPVPVTAEFESDLAFGEHHFGVFTDSRERSTLHPVVVLHDIKGVHKGVEDGIFSKLHTAVFNAGDEGIGIRLHLIDLLEVVCTE